MKRIIAFAVLVISTTVAMNAQDSMKKMDQTMADKEAMMAEKEIQTIQLEQTKGAFTQQSLTLDKCSYVFEIANNGVGHDVGFVLAPKGKTDQAHHIKEAYVTQVVATGEKQLTGTVSLEPGEYVYFCPLNPTPEYTLIVK